MADIPLPTGMWSRLNLSPKLCAVFDVCQLLRLCPQSHICIFFPPNIQPNLLYLNFTVAIKNLVRTEGKCYSISPKRVIPSLKW